MTLIEKLEFLKAEKAPYMRCSASLSTTADELVFKVSSDEYLDWLGLLRSRADEANRIPLQQRMERMYGSAARDIKNFEAVLAAFRAKFEDVLFETMDYNNALCVLVNREDAVSARTHLAIRFGRRETDADHIFAAVTYAERWKAGETEYKGIEDGFTSYGTEISASAILAGEQK